MTFEHFDRFISLAAAGLGLFLVGGVNLLLGRWKILRGVATIVVCAVVLAGLFAFTRLELATRAAWVLAGALLVTILLGSGWMSGKLAALFALLRRPAVRWGLVAVGGLVTIVASVYAFERSDLELAEQSTAELEMMVGRPPSQPSVRGSATTDRGTVVTLKEPITPRDSSELAGPEAKVLRESKLDGSVIRRGGPADDSNCHGWVFTSGKFLLGPDDVELILKENGYSEVHEPRPGDLVVYRQSGVVAHTAIVRYVSEGQPVLVEGKWGTMGVFLHPSDKSCYGTEYTFHRSTRSGHLLVGLGGSPGPNNATPPAVTE
ncbi:MAG: CHAP domain-containing protein [Planctomycetia bacterium]|nr:CHAP domain-containing protein [Planctomycetia bacterium]